MSFLLWAPRRFLSGWLLYRLAQPAPRWAHVLLVVIFWLVVFVLALTFAAELFS